MKMSKPFVLIQAHIDGHSMGRPSSSPATRNEVKEAIECWIESAHEDDQKEYFDEFFAWDWKSTFELKNGDGEYLIVECKSHTI